MKIGIQNLALINLIWLTTRLIFTASAQPLFACDPSNPLTKTYLFCETTLPIAQRTQDIVSRLTLDEKVSQLVNSADAIPRLGIPAYEWWSEALHGVSRHGKGIRFNGTIQSATMFPQIITTASSFDAKLWFRIARVSLHSLAN
ncbi:putative beta-D-xylosidase 7 [Sarracenia purpurea var. burkii]